MGYIDLESELRTQYLSEVGKGEISSNANDESTFKEGFKSGVEAILKNVVGLHMDFYSARFFRDADRQLKEL